MREVRIKCDVSVHRLEPDLVSPESVEILKLVIFAELSSFHSTKFAPVPIVFYANNLSFRESPYGRPDRCHDIPSVVDPIGGVFPVSAIRSGYEGIFFRNQISGNRRDIFGMLPVLQNIPRDIASRHYIQIFIESLHILELFANSGARFR